MSDPTKLHHFAVEINEIAEQVRKIQAIDSSAIDSLVTETLLNCISTFYNAYILSDQGRNALFPDVVPEPFKDLVKDEFSLHVRAHIEFIKLMITNPPIQSITRFLTKVNSITDDEECFELEEAVFYPRIYMAVVDYVNDIVHVIWFTYSKGSKAKYDAARFGNLYKNGLFPHIPQIAHPTEIELQELDTQVEIFSDRIESLERFPCILNLFNTSDISDLIVLEMPTEIPIVIATIPPGLLERQLRARIQDKAADVYADARFGIRCSNFDQVLEVLTYSKLSEDTEAKSSSKSKPSSSRQELLSSTKKLKVSKRKSVQSIFKEMTTTASKEIRKVSPDQGEYQLHGEGFALPSNPTNQTTSLIVAPVPFKNSPERNRKDHKTLISPSGQPHFDIVANISLPHPNQSDEDIAILEELCSRTKLVLQSQIFTMKNLQEISHFVRFPFQKTEPIWLSFTDVKDNDIVVTLCESERSIRYVFTFDIPTSRPLFNRIVHPRNDRYS